MPRTAKGPRYFASKKAWYGTFGGERLLLIKGPKKPTEERAKELYDAELAARKVEVEGDRNMVWAVLNAYLRDLTNRVATGDAAPRLLDIHSCYVGLFNAAHGKTLVKDLRPQHMTDWIAEMRTERMSEKLGRVTKWNDGTERIARNSISRAFNWAVAEAGLISANPLKRPGAGKKAKSKKRVPVDTRVAITDYEHDLLLKRAQRRSSKGFAQMLILLKRTGARPAEIHGATASEWVEERRAFRIRAVPENHGRFKLAHLGVDRWVFVPKDVVPLVHELIAQHPEGKLFRNELGKPWTRNAICARFICTIRGANKEAAARGEVGIRKTVTAYSYRHAFVTNWVKQNKPMGHLCDLLNTSDKMVRQHYSRLFEETSALQDELDSFTAGAPAPHASQPGTTS